MLFKFLFYFGEVGEFGGDSVYFFLIGVLIWYFFLMFCLMTVTYGIGVSMGFFVSLFVVGVFFG